MKRILVFIVVLIAILGGLTFWGYQLVFAQKTLISAELYVPTGSSYKDLKQQLLNEGIIDETESLDLASRLLRFRKRIRPGKYEIAAGTTVLDVCRLFRSGMTSVVKVTFHNTRTMADVAGRVAPSIEADSMEILNALNNEGVWKGLGVSSPYQCHIIPNTYEFYWDTDGVEFVERMVKESAAFWNESRLEKAKALEMSPCEVITLASIVQEEQNQQLSEQKRIAGLYINRLKKGIALQADPTLKYAAGDFSIKRVLNIHKEIVSPYNTYLNAGLPPGPITIPEPGAIDAVLNYEQHQFLYMCAKEDFSGYHNFARTLVQHNINAAKYQNALSREMRKARSK